MDRLWYYIEPWAWNSAMGILGLPVIAAFAALMRWIDNR